MQKEAKLLTIAQAAQALQVSPDTLRRWEDKGIITPHRTKGGSRRYTLLDLKIAKLNKRKHRVFQIPFFFKQNYINSKRDFKIALVTSLLWVLGLLIYNFFTPTFLRPTNPQQQIISEQLKEQSRLKIAAETSPNQIKTTRTWVISNQAPPDKHAPQVTSSGTDLLIRKLSNLPSLKFSDTFAQYYSLKSLPKN